MVLRFVLCLRDSGDCLVVVQRWFPSSEEGFLDLRARSELNICWKMPSRLMGERSERANSVQNRMCGRGDVAGVVTVTSRRGCKGSTGRRFAQSRESGLQALRRRVRRKTEKLGA